jgi:hypothetical protein
MERTHTNTPVQVVWEMLYSVIPPLGGDTTAGSNLQKEQNGDATSEYTLLAQRKPVDTNQPVHTQKTK